MRKRDTVPEHPLRAAQRENVALKDEVKFLHEALFFTEILAAGFFRGLPGRSGFGRVAVMEKETCRDCRDWFWCMEASRMYPCRDWSKKGEKKSEQAYRKESREEA